MTGDDVTPEAEGFLRRAIALAAAAREAGNPPFGSLLVGADGTVLAEQQNTTITDRDISFHPELKLAVWAARELSPEQAAGTTMYTSCQPCPMCTGALARSGLGRVVYALSGDQLDGLKSTGGFPAVPQEGPALYDEARVPVDGYYS
jgi:tRNA(Arg) A34 adenosine deaminase TadA